MSWVPPTIVRRLVTAPLVLLAEAAVVVASPLLAVIAAVASPLAGGWRPVRLVAIAVGYAARHLAAALACLGLWIASGLGRRADSPRFRRAHYAVLRWFVGGVYRSITRWARVAVEVTGSGAAKEVLSAGRRPVVVLSRHAGEGDSLLVLHALLCRHRRRPRIVLHHALRMDPLIDLLGGRLPNRFVDPRGGDTEVEIAAMTRDVEDDEAVLIFPEGGNFSPARRRRGIERLEEAGHHEEAAWAREMDHVIAPRPGGALAALEAAPHADVVLMGHVGVPVGFRELWHLLPARQTVQLRMWLVPAGEIPADRDDRIDWLFGCWRTLDEWVDSEKGAAQRR
ncbi:MAG TPA: 1-acyl-sn-glycerol-3-phosphate acyltransferase [Solirubrobacteraceae bacterium]|nr:1-acyl-sn-glycerol-3-phosphate acyltransferase [Solirubrobacteraceae bacterium]